MRKTVRLWCGKHRGMQAHEDDIVQQVALRFMREQSTLMEGIRHAHDPNAFLVRAVEHIAISYWRTLHSGVPLEPHCDLDALVQAAEVIEDTLARREALHRVLPTLRAKERELLGLRYWEGLTVPQIAERLRLHRSTVAMRLLRLLPKIRDKLTRAEGGKSA